MRLLVLGGTAFVGRAIVEGALRSGADVTLSGRGRTGTGLFPGVPRLAGLVRPYWPGQQRSPAKARAAGLPATPLQVTAADVLAWGRQRGEPPLQRGFTPEQEQVVLAAPCG